MTITGLNSKFSLLRAPVTFGAICFLALSSTALALVPSTIYVSGGEFASPYYSFYENSGLTGLLDIAAGGSESLLTSETYTFIKDSTSHPFYISDQGYNAQSSTFNITLGGDGSSTNGIGGGEWLTLSFNNFNAETDTLSYYCSSHSSMLSSFNVAAVPEQSYCAAVFGLLGLSIVLSRRKIRHKRY
jgi:hypothetical protein